MGLPVSAVDNPADQRGTRKGNLAGQSVSTFMNESAARRDSKDYGPFLWGGLLFVMLFTAMPQGRSPDWDLRAGRVLPKDYPQGPMV
jgi:hypothetical protein